MHASGARGLHVLLAQGCHFRSTAIDRPEFEQQFQCGLQADLKVRKLRLLMPSNFTLMRLRQFAPMTTPMQLDPIVHFNQHRHAQLLRQGAQITHLHIIQAAGRNQQIQSAPMARAS